MKRRPRSCYTSKVVGEVDEDEGSFRISLTIIRLHVIKEVDLHRTHILEVAPESPIVRTMVYRCATDPVALYEKVDR